MKNRGARKVIIILFWLLLWQAAALLIHNVILLAGPVEFFRCLLRLCFTAAFWRAVATSLLAIAAGFLGGFAAGVLLGSAAYRFPLFGEFLQPPVSLIKSVPVASFVILALVWVGSGRLSVLISFLVTFPVIYIDTRSGLASTDPKLLEMAGVFSVNLWGRVRFIYVPALLPYLISAAEIALGSAFKAGIAAEVIGIPAHSIGERLYMAKIYLETGDVLAWTIVIILLSVVTERLFLALLKKLERA